MKTRNIKLTIEYDGTDFNGWQVQSKDRRTVQGEIETALATILKKKTRVHGSGRTDSGVHALGQIANFKTTSTMPCDAFCRALNTYLPKDIVIHHADDAPADFHAQFSAKRKIYRYTILSRQTPCAINRRFCTHIPYKLNITAMKIAAKALQGNHDFQSFAASDPAKRRKGVTQNTVRNIYLSDLKKQHDYLIYEIESDGFLYKMVRNIVGTLIAVGCGQLDPKKIVTILKAKNRDTAGDTAPPQGLCLIKVIY